MSDRTPNVTIDKLNNILIIHLEQRFDAFETEIVESWLKENINFDSTHIIADMSNVIFIDSRGLSILVKWLKRTRESGNHLVVANIQQSIRVIFELTYLENEFKIVSTVADAVETINQLETKSIESETTNDIQPIINNDTRQKSYVLLFEENTQVLQLSGRFDAFVVDEIKTILGTFITEENPNLIINLRAVNFLDSAGMAYFVRLLKLSRSYGGDTILIRSEFDEAHRILELTQFDQIFTIHKDMENALLQFK